MRARSVHGRRLRSTLASLALLALAAPAYAQWQPSQGVPGGSCPPYQIMPTPPMLRPDGTGGQQQFDQGSGGQQSGQGTGGQQQAAAPNLGGFDAGAGGGETSRGSSVGYIDSALPTTQFRLRVDSAYGDYRPDRAEYFYAKCGCLRAIPIALGGDPNAAGPRLMETRVNYQDIRSYFEYAPSDRFSAFVEVPFRFLNPEQNANTAGVADMNVGFKYAFIANDCTFLTGQFRTYIPTGDSNDGLGTNHVSLEPKVLLWHKFSDRLFLEGEVGDWIPIGGSDFSGNVVDYGVGLSYYVINECNFRVAPVVEFLGWTCLSGRELDGFTGAVTSARGDTIINGKIGLRFGFGRTQDPGLRSKSDFYVGYSHALTGDAWYTDMVRFEYRLRF